MSRRALRSPLFALGACVFVALSAAGCSGRASVSPGTAAPANALGKIAYVEGGDIYVEQLRHGTPQRITTHDDSWGNTAYSSPRWSPSGEWLLADTNGQAAVMRADGSDERVYPGRFTQPVWSPVADRLAYTSDSAEGGFQSKLLVEDADGSNEKVVARTQPGAGENAILPNTTVAWSPDGVWVAYTEQRWTEAAGQHHNTYDAILRVAADGSAPAAELFKPGSPPAYGIGLIAWSRDGANIVFTALPAFTADVADGAAFMRIAAQPNAREQTLTDAPMLTGLELWSFGPDGSMAATGGSGRETWTHKQLQLIDILTGAWRLLTDPVQAAIEPAWSSDASQIAYASAPDAGPLPSDAAKAALAARKIWTVSAIEPPPTTPCISHACYPPTRQLTSDSSYRDEYPQWSADGSQLLWVRIDAQDNASLWLMNADGTDQRQLVGRLEVPGAANATSPGLGYYGTIQWQRSVAWWRPSPTFPAHEPTPSASSSSTTVASSPSAGVPVRPVFLAKPNTTSGDDWSVETRVSNLNTLDLAIAVDSASGGLTASLIDVPSGETVGVARLPMGDDSVRLREHPRELVATAARRLLVFSIGADRLTQRLNVPMPDLLGYQDFANAMQLSPDGRHAYLPERIIDADQEQLCPAGAFSPCFTLQVAAVDLDTGAVAHAPLPGACGAIYRLTPLTSGGAALICEMADGQLWVGRVLDDGGVSQGSAIPSYTPNTSLAYATASTVSDGTLVVLRGDGAVWRAGDVAAGPSLLPAGDEVIDALRIDDGRVLVLAGPAQPTVNVHVTTLLVVDLTADRVVSSVGAPPGYVDATVLDSTRALILAKDGDAYSTDVLDLSSGGLATPDRLSGLGGGGDHLAH